MTAVSEFPLTALYEQDETAWLEIMSRLAAEGRFGEMDCANLSDFLADMAKRDRREVMSRLVTLLVHLLKWKYQPKRRSRSWRLTVLEQRRELEMLLESRTLRNHALSSLAKAYANAREQAAVATGLSLGAFPAECEWDVDHVLVDEE